MLGKLIFWKVAMKFNKSLFALACVLTLSVFANQVSAETLIPLAGKTEVQLSSNLVGALTSLGVTPEALKPGTLSKRGIAAFPITTGALEGLRGEIDHSGGLTFSAGETHVVVSSFVIDLLGPKPVLTGLVIANSNILARAPLFDLDTNALDVLSKGKRVVLSNVGLTLNKNAADLLNQVFGVTAFTEGLPIGKAKVRITNSMPDYDDHDHHHHDH
jgi:hypothetical protein